MDRRAIEVVITGLPLIAFAELLARDTAERRRQERHGGWGLPPRGGIVLVVADRDRWDRLDPLLESVRRHQPQVRVWIGAAELLVEASTSGAPALRLARDEAPMAPPAQVPESASKSEEPDAPPERSRSPMQEAVTPEEIEMLLRLFDADPDATRADDAGDRP